ncbi:MAG: hypothetical protein ABIN91_07215 [Mucilaginibacter sp.]|uniref:hypothetical protein n=1 Tax=Mucilaginibacter sp. TaxID=1882438 RepID=UPI003267866C
MSNGVDIEVIRKTYERKTDEELVRVVTQNSAGLTPEAIDVVKAELKKRNIDASVARSVDAQNKQYTIEEIDAYCAIIQNLPCPVTGSTDEKLNATIVAEVISFIIFTNYKKKMLIASPDALDKANNNALVKTAILGWWGIPWGIIKTIQAINLNIKNKRSNRADGPNDYLRGFVLSRVGQIEAFKDNPNKLAEIISL